MASLPLTAPPQSLCLLRLSAIGDISHALPLVRTLQTRWPQTRLTWIIGRAEHALVGDIPGIEFIIFDKARRWRAFADLRRALRGRRFDVLLHMQTALRASLASLAVHADIRLGFDRARAKDLQWLFTNARIPHHPRQHVLESFFGFAEALGINERELRWEIPIPAEARRFAEVTLPAEPFIVISPCASKPYRNWNAAGYAAVGDWAAAHRLQVVLCGGPSALEREYGERIAAAMVRPPLNLIGKTILKELVAVLARARVVVAPDAGPAHLATAVGTPVVGLYAATNPDRARPYLSAAYVVNRYPEAVRDRYGKPPEALPWGIRVRKPGTMNRIEVADVVGKLEAVIAGADPPRG